MSASVEGSAAPSTPTKNDAPEAVNPIDHNRSYGDVVHIDLATNEVLKHPRPSNDPNDPLNWSQAYKWYISGVVCLTMFTCNFLAAGPSIQIVEITLDFFPPTDGPAGIPASIAKCAYFFTTTALFQGVGTLVWIPFLNKYGRRPAYLLSYVLYLATTLWLAFDKNYGSFLAGRMILGFSAGAAEAFAPVTIADLFFLHERGAAMSLYTMALSAGVAGGMIICGGISTTQTWRVDYYLAAALVGAILLLLFFTLPETAWNRVYEEHHAPLTEAAQGISYMKNEKAEVETAEGIDDNAKAVSRTKDSYGRCLHVFSGAYTKENLFLMMVRPILLILLPPVLWASLIMAVTIGFLVAISSNVAPAFAQAYGFGPLQSALCFVGALIGSALGIYFGGRFTDIIADYLTRRNNGVREPEFRLVSIVITLITAPLALLLYGAGIQYQFHWMMPTMGLLLLNFSIVQGCNVSLVYTIDAYLPIAGEVTVTQVAFKSLFGFLLSFYTNPWVAESGYLNAYGEMAAISAAIILTTVPLFFYGKCIREATTKWWIMKYVAWDEDRDL